MVIEAVDLFCGIGGLTHGIIKAGINVVAGIDIDATCEYAYTKNNEVPFIEKSIEDVVASEIIELFNKYAIKILMGCAPCQPFSKYSYRYNKNGYKDDKWRLLYEFLRLVEEVNPNIVSMENVPKLAKTKIFFDFIKKLEELGYYVHWSIVNCAQYEVPQNRYRLVLLASKFGEISLIDPVYDEKTYLTVKDAISHLEPIDNGETSKKDPMHRASKLSKINLQRIQQSVPGGNWTDWDETLLLNCHKKKTGKTYKSIYGRMEWGKPSPTITTQFYGYGNGRFGHPEQNRAISLREGAVLQSFPLYYKFLDIDNKLPNRVIGTHIGNAVPVKLGTAIGESILEHINNLGGEKTGGTRKQQRCS